MYVTDQLRLKRDFQCFIAVFLIQISLFDSDCCFVFVVCVCVCMCLWPGGKHSVPFRSECERLSQESLAEHCKVKLMPPTTRTSPHITGRFFFFLLSLFLLLFFCLLLTRMHILLLHLFRFFCVVHMFV